MHDMQAGVGSQNRRGTILYDWCKAEDWNINIPPRPTIVTSAGTNPQLGRDHFQEYVRGHLQFSRYGKISMFSRTDQKYVFFFSMRRT